MSGRLGVVAGTTLDQLSGEHGLETQPVIAMGDGQTLMVEAKESPDDYAHGNLSSADLRLVSQAFERAAKMFRSEQTLAPSAKTASAPSMRRGVRREPGQNGPQAQFTPNINAQQQAAFERALKNKGNITFPKLALMFLSLRRNSGTDLGQYVRGQDRNRLTKLVNSVTRSPSPQFGKRKTKAYDFVKRRKPIFLRDLRAENVENAATPEPSLVVAPGKKFVNTYGRSIGRRQYRPTAAFKSLKNPRVVPAGQNLAMVLNGPTRPDNYDMRPKLRKQKALEL